MVKPALGLFVVADGMGGHNAGEVASKLVATSLDNYFASTIDGEPETPMAPGDEKLSRDARRLVRAVRKANRDVYVISTTHTQHHGMGSTVVAIHLADGYVHIAHVGDSRCYRLRGGSIQQLTRDHSLVNDAIELKPDLTPEEINRLPKNIITRALGMRDAVKVDIRSERVETGDIFLLCSDGLSGMVPQDLIRDVIGLCGEPREACELLIAEANEAGGNDNISALIVQIDHREPETEELTHEEVEAVAKDLDLDLPGAWAPQNGVRRCRFCAFELFPGNTFCVECGARIEAQPS